MCTLYPASSSRTQSETDVVLTVDLQSSPAFSGSKDIWMIAKDLGHAAGNWIKMGTWNVPALITGQVTYLGAGVSGTTMTLAGTQTGSTTTDASGNYSFYVTAGGNYTVTASKTNYSFTPNPAVINGAAGTQTANFTATAVNYTIGGRATLGGSGLSGVTMSLTGSKTASTTTDANGNYSFNEPALGNYTVTPSKATYWFSPASATFNSLGANQTANFTAAKVTVQISNTTRGGSTVFYVGDSFTLTVNGPPNQLVTYNYTQNGSGGSWTMQNTNASGVYSTSGTMGAAQLGSWTETWFVGGIQATPTLAFNVYGIYSISGRVTFGSSGYAGVTVTLSGSASGSKTTDANGNYSFANLLGNGTYTVRASKTNATFSSALTYSYLAANQAAANFTATAVGATVTLTDLNRSTQPYKVGDSFRVNITGAPGQTVTVSQTKNGVAGGPYTMGATDAYGNWSTTSSWASSDVGAYTQTWKVGTTQATPTISFTVSN